MIHLVSGLILAWIRRLKMLLCAMCLVKASQVSNKQSWGWCWGGGHYLVCLVVLMIRCCVRVRLRVCMFKLVLDVCVAAIMYGMVCTLDTVQNRRITKHGAHFCLCVCVFCCAYTCDYVHIWSVEQQWARTKAGSFRAGRRAHLRKRHCILYSTPQHIACRVPPFILVCFGARSKEKCTVTITTHTRKPVQLVHNWNGTITPHLFCAVHMANNR